LQGRAVGTEADAGIAQVILVIEFVDPGAAGVNGAAVRYGHLVGASVFEDKDVGILPVFPGTVLGFEQLVVAVIGVFDPPGGGKGDLIGLVEVTAVADVNVFTV